MLLNCLLCGFRAVTIFNNDYFEITIILTFQTL